MSKHTLAPWHSAENAAFIGVYNMFGDVVAKVPVKGEISKPRSTADARLIAASPELLKALQSAMQALAAAKEAMPVNWEANALCEQAEDIADAAIAKATKEQA